MRLPVGISDFKDLIEGEYLFADKTLFIKDVMEDGAKVLLITRPRRFGKTLNLSMLYYFLSKNHGDEKNLFEGLNISKDEEFCKKHQQQYPAIFISFKNIKEDNYEKAYNRITELIRQLYEGHRYLLEGDILSESEKAMFMDLIHERANEAKVKGALQQLAIWIGRKFNQPPLILIDEYDTPIQEAYLRENHQGRQGYYQNMMDLMRGILGDALKDNRPNEKIVSKAILTGITRIAQESLFSGMNNLAVYTLLREKFGQYFGFTEEEVSKLLAESKQQVSITSIKEWYNGYQIGKYVLYNPWSIISCLDHDGQLKPYWVHTASNELISELLKDARPEVKQQFEELLQGNVIDRPLSENLVFLDIKTSEAALWSLLLYAGYLKILSCELQGYQLMARIAIPNKEVGFVYDQVVAGWFTHALGFDSYLDFVRSLVNGDMDKFKACLSNYIMQTGSYFDFHKNTHEQIFHIFVLGLVVGLRDRYYIHSNKETGLGRCDVLFVPKNKKDRGILLEFKTSKTVELLLDKAQEALEQIKNNRYIETLKQHNIDSVLAIGLAFWSKEVELVHETISI
ncbi:MAG: AAA family ATPase [Verrucomicrobia bacterium]|nr:MAG: AAA family ATPase [Verrucomicrobiota bacterium]